MDAQQAPAALGEDVEVAARLRRLDSAEAVATAGHVELRGIIAGDLEKDAGIGAAFIGLAGGMQEARPEADAGRDVLGVADGMAHRLQRRLVRSVALDI